MYLNYVPVLKIFWCLGKATDHLGLVPAVFEGRRVYSPSFGTAHTKNSCRCIPWRRPRCSSYVVINGHLRMLKETQWILFQYKQKSSSMKNGYKRNGDFYTFSDLCISVRNVLLGQIIASPCWVFWFQQCQLDTVFGESMSIWSKEILHKSALPL